jgi:hypothetical protein
MNTLKTIERVFKTTFPESFRKLWELFLDKKVYILKVYNYEDFYVLNELAIAEMNTEKDDTITLEGELDKVRNLFQNRPTLQDFVPVATIGLLDIFYNCLAFKKVNGVISDESIYHIWCFLDAAPETINVKKIASKYSDLFGDEMHVNSLIYGTQPAGDQVILRATDNLYSHLFDSYLFLDGYPDTLAKELNRFFSMFDDIHFFDERGHTLYCETGGIRSMVLTTGDNVMQSLAKMNVSTEPTEVIYNNLQRILAGKLSDYKLVRFQWNFYRGDVASIGLGLTRNKNIEPLLDQYGMLFNNYN